MDTTFSFEPLSGNLSGRRIKAGFHCHTVHSDGGLSVNATVERYREKGYQCLGITDHRKVTSWENGDRPSDFVLLDSTENGGWPDIIGVGVKTVAPTELSLQERAAILAGQGGFTIAAHPTYCGACPGDYLGCSELMAMEIYNAMCDAAYTNGYATELWDMLLGRGKRILGVAADDAHLNTKKRLYSDAGRGWVEIWEQDLRPAALLHALKQGRFFSTQGPVFEKITVSEKTIQIQCSPVQQVRWRTFGRVGHVEYAGKHSAIDHSSMELPDMFRHPWHYFRIELVDAQGKKAWSNPFYMRADI